MIKNCKICKTEFITYLSRIKRGHGVFCSHKCINIGRKQPKEWVEMIKKSTTGNKAWNWKGDKVGYRSLHTWIIRKLGKANHCKSCGLDKIPKGKKRYFDWANISQKYKRDITDWKQLCKKCHGKERRKKQII